VCAGRPAGREITTAYKNDAHCVLTAKCVCALFFLLASCYNCFCAAYCSGRSLFQSVIASVTELTAGGKNEESAEDNAEQKKAICVCVIVALYVRFKLSFANKENTRKDSTMNDISTVRFSENMVLHRDVLY